MTDAARRRGARRDRALRPDRGRLRAHRRDAAAGHAPGRRAPRAARAAAALRARLRAWRRRSRGASSRCRCPAPSVFRDAEELLYGQLGRLRKRITHETTSVRLVVTPERMVIDEARRAWTELSLFEVGCDAVVLNRLLPEDAARGGLLPRVGAPAAGSPARGGGAVRAAAACSPAPLAPDEVTGLARLAEHGAQIFAGVAPDALLSSAPRVRFAREGDDVPGDGAAARAPSRRGSTSPRSTTSSRSRAGCAAARSSSRAGSRRSRSPPRSSKGPRWWCASRARRPKPGRRV